MNKVITIEESAMNKTSSKDLMSLTNKVKTKSGKVGTSGILRGNIFYRILKNGFIIF